MSCPHGNPIGGCDTCDEVDAAFEAGKRSALAEQPAQQEPAGWRPATFHRDNLTFNPRRPDEQTVKFWKLQGVEIEYCYTSPPAQRTWVGLTDEEIEQGCKESWVTEQAWQSAVWWAEAKLRSKNEDRN